MNEKLKTMFVVAALLGGGFTSVASAQQTSVRGTVEKIDKEGGKITLKHGPIKNLDMDGMTMAFRVKDVGALDKLKVGQNVRFEADRVDGQITITKIQSAK